MLLQKKHILTLLLGFISVLAFAAQIKGKVVGDSFKPVAGVLVKVNEFATTTDSLGNYTLDEIPKGEYTLVTEHENYLASVLPVSIKDASEILQMDILLMATITTDVVEVFYEKELIGTGSEVSKEELSTGKTKLVITIDESANHSAAPGRSLIAPVSFIENDGAGLQLGIGGRGLNPKRTAHYNTRQNGYDIAADALGYPETYYTPPTEAIASISILRGAASLQYGPQFGGMINFELKDGPSDPNKSFEFLSKNSYGSFNQYHSFNSLGLKKGDFKIYSFYHFKHGDGWRENSAYNANTAYIGINYNPNEALDLDLQLTHHNYLAQQAGGLTDLQFSVDPQASHRERNWFTVDWNIAALKMNYAFSEKSWINSRTFAVFASRQSLGFLEAPSRADLGQARTLINGDFRNIGNETRFFQRYAFNDQQHGVFLAGVRLYQGWAQTEQGTGDATAEPNFAYVNPNGPDNSQYTFPSHNISLFAENAFYINQKLSITPGVRYEYIQTGTKGYFQRFLMTQGGDTLDVVRTEEPGSEKTRQLVLGGLGVNYKLGEFGKFIANISQNYRSVNFSDVSISIPNFKVDPNISDERGFTFDLGFNKSWGNTGFISISSYYLNYANRIGVVWQTDPETYDTYQLRTNISSSESFGLEFSGWLDLAKITTLNDSLQSLTVFTSATLTHATYTGKGTIVEGNKVEMVPGLTLKSGVNYRFKKLTASGIVNYQTQQFSEATNATSSNNGLYGIIPSFYVLDAKLGYTLQRITFQTSVTNLTNQMYFTQRATSYPGPGIIPSEGRTIWFGAIVKL